MLRLDRLQVQLDTLDNVQRELNEVVATRVARGQTFTIGMVKDILSSMKQNIETELEAL